MGDYRDKLHSYRSTNTTNLQDESFLVDDIMSGVPKKNTAPIHLQTKLTDNQSANKKYICMVGKCSGAI